MPWLNSWERYEKLIILLIWSDYSHALKKKKGSGFFSLFPIILFWIIKKSFFQNLWTGYLRSPRPTCVMAQPKMHSDRQIQSGLHMHEKWRKLMRVCACLRACVGVTFSRKSPHRWVVISLNQKQLLLLLLMFSKLTFESLFVLNRRHVDG